MPSYTKNKLSVKSEPSLKSIRKAINFNEGLCVAIKFSFPCPPCIGCHFLGLGCKYLSIFFCLILKWGQGLRTLAAPHLLEVYGSTPPPPIPA